ncbi:MAG: hypothetical protein M1818_003794 [Claussenomyces sp. TS43310]|nr:MAG: hypothetical protein M1818_003794 [Claussenomyces sp. TS43310]
MDLAQTLMRSVMRSFYDTKHILVIDALIIHSALRDDDLAHLMGSMNTKELHKLCGKLREDRFLAVHTRSEIKEGQQRPISRTYYYIDYRSAIDAIKWRVYSIDKAVQGTTVAAEDRKEFSCPRCKAQWTQMEVLDNVDFEKGFLCHKCRFPLVRNDDTNRGGHELSTKLNAQFKFITDLLPKIDQVVIPDNTFEVALAAARQVVRDPLLHPASETVPTTSAANKPTAVKGLSNTGPTSISVTVTSTEGPTAADKATEQARKDALAAQNQLPAHFTHSTVTGEQVVMTSSVSPLKRSQSVDDEKGKKEALVSTPSISGDGAEIDSYFAQLKAEQAREAVKEQEEEFETDDDEEDEDEEDVGFEDVVPNGTMPGSDGGTPASSASANGDGSKTSGGLASVLKKSGSAAPSSGASTQAASPATGSQTPESGRAVKKVRIEEPSSKTVKDEEESEEDVEFEDV